MGPFHILQGLNGLGRGISVKRIFMYCTFDCTERGYIGHRSSVTEQRERRRLGDRQTGRPAGKATTGYGIDLDLAYSDLVEETQTAFGNLKIPSQLDDANCVT